ncbi:hypothetical protein K7432_012590 [Basidiobolus ranarum]|uniref:Uncharacterized protein n=1 Tax=Basidiobolus ranarum TaxID=34480 RepID=A0ABR2VSH0_9FUNG
MSLNIPAASARPNASQGKITQILAALMDMQETCTPQAMKDYNSNSKVQAQFNQFGIEVLNKTVQNLDIGSTFTIGDYGCSHGRNSMTVINAILDSIHARRSNTQPLTVQVYHNDLPLNDFGEVFKCLQDPTLTYQNHSLVNSNPDHLIITMISAKSFYSQCLPNDHVDLAISFNCVHWLQSISTTLYRPLTLYSSQITTDQKRQIQEAGHCQLVSFLRSRAMELRLDGHLVFSLLNRLDTLRDMDAVWQQHIEEYNIDINLLDATLVPVLLRTQEDIERAIREVPSLSLISCTEYSRQTDFGRGEYGIAQLKATVWPQLQTGLTKRNVFSNDSQLAEFIDTFFMKVRSFDESRQEEILSAKFVTVKKVSNA